MSSFEAFDDTDLLAVFDLLKLFDAPILRVLSRTCSGGITFRFFDRAGSYLDLRVRAPSRKAKHPKLSPLVIKAYCANADVYLQLSFREKADSEKVAALMGLVDEHRPALEEELRLSAQWKAPMQRSRPAPSPVANSYA